MNVQAFHDRTTGTFSYIVDDGQGACAVIDPVLGFDPVSGRLDPSPLEPLARWMSSRALRPAWLLETHVHADHLSGAQWLKARFGGLVAIGAAVEAAHRLLQPLFPDLGLPGAAFDHLLQPGEGFRIGRLRAEAMAVPGHTPADLAYRVRAADGGPDAVFVGDSLFMPAAGTARCDFPGGSAAQLYRSVRRLLALPEGTRLHVGHDYPDPDGEARCMATVAEHRARNVHVRDGIAEDAFVALREARDRTLALPRLMLPSLQVNLRAGRMPPPAANGLSYLQLPVDGLCPLTPSA